MLERENLEKMKKDELLALAHEKNIEISNSENKNTIIETIVSSEKEPVVRPRRKNRTIAKLASRNSEKISRRRSFTVDPEDRNKRIDSKEDITAAEIKTSMTSNRILTGEIASVYSKKIGDQIIYCVIVNYGQYQVSIPAQYLVELTAEEAKDENKLKEICENRLGSIIDFKVINEDLGDGVPKAMANRLAAMDILKKRIWLSKEKVDVRRMRKDELLSFAKENDIDIGDLEDKNEISKLIFEKAKENEIELSDWKIRVGQIVQGRLASIVKAGIFVEVGGVETFIPNVELSHMWIRDARTLYSSSDRKIDMVIKSISRDPETGDVSFNASVKDLKPNDKAIIYSGIMLGSLCYGITEEVNLNPESRNGKSVLPYAYVQLSQGYTCRCKLKDKIPMEGEPVRVRIVHKDDKNMRIFGDIQHIDRASIM